MQKEICDSKANFERLNEKITNFNKEKDDLSSLITNSKAHNDKSGLGYKQVKSKSSTRYAFMYTNFSASTSKRDSPKTTYSHDSTLFRNNRKYFSGTKLVTNNIRIWVPPNTSNHDKQLYISNYYENVINNENYIYKGSTIST